MYPARGQFDHEQHVVRDEAAAGPGLDRKEVRSRETFPVSFEKVLQDVCFARSGAGSIPWALRTLLMVVRPTSCPRLAKAPRMVV